MSVLLQTDYIVAHLKQLQMCHLGNSYTGTMRFFQAQTEADKDTLSCTSSITVQVFSVVTGEKKVL